MVCSTNTTCTPVITNALAAINAVVKCFKAESNLKSHALIWNISKTTIKINKFKECGILTEKASELNGS